MPNSSVSGTKVCTNVANQYSNNAAQGASQSPQAVTNPVEIKIIKI